MSGPVAILCSFPLWKKKKKKRNRRPLHLSVHNARCWSGVNGLSWALECTGTWNCAWPTNVGSFLFFCLGYFLNSVKITVFINQLPKWLFRDLVPFFVQWKIDVRQPSQDSPCVCAQWGNHSQNRWFIVLRVPIRSVLAWAKLGSKCPHCACAELLRLDKFLGTSRKMEQRGCFYHSWL